jgi:formate hydrogenlyase transcriptional activator
MSTSFQRPEIELTNELTRESQHPSGSLSEQELRGIVDAIPHLIIVLNADGSPIYANKFVMDYTGLTDDEVRRQGVRARVFHPDDLPALEKGRREGMAAGQPFETEQRARRHDGQYRWFLSRYYPLRDEGGCIVRWYSTAMDIDDRKRAEERVLNENLVLREDIDRFSMFEGIVGSSKALRKVLTQVSKVAKTDATVLILGETGTGKGLIARAIHRQSARANRAFIHVNCAAIPTSLIASELFGYEKGAFTGALQRRIGRFEAADGGTILLDEVGDLLLDTQVTLLRVLQEREIERVGSNTPIPVDVRVIAATHRNIEDAVESGAFRQDLYYRLNVVPIVNPPLRERAEDIPVLVEFLVSQYAKRLRKTIRTIEKRTMALLKDYDWPGNVRELQNVVERAVVLCEGDTFYIDDSWLTGTPSKHSHRTGRSMMTLAEGEKDLILTALKSSLGKISGPSGAARKLGVPRQTLESKIQALDIDATSFRAR